MSERIEGEFHYAEEQELDGRKWWNVYRADDGDFCHAYPDHVTRSGKRIYVNPKNKIDQLDEQARHSIQQGREEAFAEVDAAAEKVADHTQDLIACAPRKDTRMWTVYGLHDNEHGTTGPTFTAALKAATEGESE